MALLCALMQAQAAKLPFRYDQQYLPNSATVSFLAKNVHNPQVVMAQNAPALMPPASLQKMVTALAASLYLPRDFSFSTTLELAKQHVVIRFAGDPTLTDQDLLSLLKQYRRVYGAKIRGDIILDDSAFNGHDWAEGVTWDNFSACYCVPSNAMTLNRNCVYAWLNSHLPAGKVANIQMASNRSLKAKSSALIVSKTREQELNCSLDASLAPRNEYAITGCIVRTQKALPLRFAVQNSGLYVKERIAHLARQANIQIKGRIRMGVAKDTKVVAIHDSEPLGDLLDTLLKESDNLIADNLLKEIGRRYFKQPGNYTNGVKAVEAILRDKAGIDLSTAHLVDGSGLSRNNRMTPIQLMQILEYMYTHDDQLGLLSMLPVSGLSGTLKYRKSFRDGFMEGRVTAKTGAIFATHNLAGFIDVDRGAPLLFVQMVTDYIPSEKSNGEGAQNKPREAQPLVKFERAIYKDLSRYMDDNKLTRKSLSGVAK